MLADSLGMQAGADMLREDGRYGDFSSKAFRRAFEFYVDIFREGLAPKDSNSMISNGWRMARYGPSSRGTI